MTARWAQRLPAVASFAQRLGRRHACLPLPSRFRSHRAGRRGLRTQRCIAHTSPLPLSSHSQGLHIGQILLIGLTSPPSVHPGAGNARQPRPRRRDRCRHCAHATVHRRGQAARLMTRKNPHLHEARPRASRQFDVAHAQNPAPPQRQPAPTHASSHVAP